MISIVIPAFNEAATIRKHSEIIFEKARISDESIEIIIVDDGSSDSTATIIQTLSEENEYFSPIFLARNFGKEAAIHAGIEQAKGDAVIIIDADLQHPPSLIPKMIDAWKQGAPLVEAIKSTREDTSFANRLFAKAFYFLYKKLSDIDINDRCDFKLLDRELVDIYLAMPERYRFFRGLVEWTGVKGEIIPFDVEGRSDGPSRWSKTKLVQYALNNITAFSTLPLHIITLLGTSVIVFGLLLALWTLGQKLLGFSVDGFTTVNILLIGIGGSIMVSLGIIGHYIGRIYFELKSRPFYIKKPKKRYKPNE